MQPALGQEYVTLLGLGLHAGEWPEQRAAGENRG
jgi:hypothetical protein